MQRGSFFSMQQRLSQAHHFVGIMLIVVWLTIVASMPAAAQKIRNEIAVFAALDKVTARVSKLEVRIGETARFGALKITPRVCYTREPTEPPQTSTFVEVDEVMLNNEQRRVFTGWMFAESPGISGLEHQVFDVWLTSCKMASGGASSGNR